MASTKHFAATVRQVVLRPDINTLPPARLLPFLRKPEVCVKQEAASRAAWVTQQAAALAAAREVALAVTLLVQDVCDLLKKGACH
jgi:hypothetical protein